MSVLKKWDMSFLFLKDLKKCKEFKNEPLRILKGLIDYFSHPDREEYEKCAILLKAAKSYRNDKKEFNKLKKTTK